MTGGSPWDLEAALAWGGGFALATLLLALLLDRSRPFDRLLFTSCAMLPVAIYLHWRITQTLPAMEWDFEALWARFFLFFESLSILYTLGAAIIMTRCSACEFHGIVGMDSTASWAAIPRDDGH